MSSQEEKPTDGNEIEIPPKFVEGETVEDRLSDIVINDTLPARYLEKDENGNVIENPKELFERVAKNISLAEVVFEANKLDITITVTPDQIKDNHSRRGELAAEVFGVDFRTYNNLDDVPDTIEEIEPNLLNEEVELTEHNVSKFSYDNIVPELENDDLVEHVETIKDQFEKEISHLRIMPNSPTLMNAGSELQQLSACFVISPDDSMTDIHETIKEAAEVFRTGGGMGYGFWRLRPRGDQVGSTGGIASGPITFMRTFDQMCETVAQGGVRRGAQMGVMRVDHPDIIEFIHAKNNDVSLANTLRLNDPDDPTHNNFGDALEEAKELVTEDGKVPKHLRNAAEGHLSNFNISVGVTDEFMQAVKDDSLYTLRNPKNGEPHVVTEGTKKLYDIYDLGDHIEIGDPLKLPAREIYKRIVKGNHENGEPGMVFLERANKQHSFPVESTPTSEHSKHELLATNPCGEQYLEEYEACNLNHINLSTLIDPTNSKEDLSEKFVKTFAQPEGDIQAQDFREFDRIRREEYGYTGEQSDPEHVAMFLNQAIDWEEFEKRVYVGTRFLDNVVTMSEFPVEKIEETVRKNRKIGLGIMGLAQLLIQLGVQYGDDVSQEVTEQLMIYINRLSKQASHEMAVNQDRGSFETIDESKFGNPTKFKEYFEHHTGRDAENWEDRFPIRNHNTTTIAPTGTTSQIGRTTGGCEPIFSVVHLRVSSDDINEGKEYTQIDDYFRRVLEANGIDPEEVIEEAVRQQVSDEEEYTGIEGLTTVPDKLSEVFIVVDDLNPKEHIDMQAAAQKGVDSSISKTINASNDTTLEESEDIFLYAYDSNLKGITYYRDGTRNKQIKSIGRHKGYSGEEELDTEDIIEIINEKYDSITQFANQESVQEAIEQEISKITDLINVDNLSGGFTRPRHRSETLTGPTTRIETGYGKVYITITTDDQNNPFEVFCRMGSSGGLYNSFTEALGKSISIGLRSGVAPEEYIDTLTGNRMPKLGFDQGEKIRSIPEAIGIALKRHQRGELNIGNEQKTLEEMGTQTGSEAEETIKESKNGTPSQNGKLENGNRDSEGVDKILANGESPECPNCNAIQLAYVEGCKTCQDCGWSEC